MKENKLKLSLEEARVVDNELYVAQCRMSYINRPTTDDVPPTAEQKKYKKIIDNLRVRIGKYVQRDVVEKSIDKDKPVQPRTGVK